MILVIRRTEARAVTPRSTTAMKQALTHTRKTCGLPRELTLASIKCIDLGGNSDTKETTYTVEVDNTPPVVTRAYHEDNYLKIATEDPAQCFYSLDDCSYITQDGVALQSFDDYTHYVEWNAGENLLHKM